MQRTNLVVVGGGAGGLELVSRLSRSRTARKRLNITLVDKDLTHIWKPLWHEVIAGTFSPEDQEVNYLHHAFAYGYRFEPGELLGVDRQNKQIRVSSVLGEYGEQAVDERQISYDQLVLATGSVSYDLGIKGVADYCMYLDSIAQCQKLHQRILSCLLWHQYHPTADKVSHIALIGGGATGVELVAELDETIEQLHRIGFNRLPKDHIQLHIIEAADHLLPALPCDIGDSARKQLHKRGITVHVGDKVSAVTETEIQTSKGHHIPADIKIWTAGIKASHVMKNLDGLEVNKLNQLVVNSSLQSSHDPNIFAMGDCAHCSQPNTSKPVPPRAQAANQQAKFLAKAISRLVSGKKLPNFYYHDHGSLITLSQMKTIGLLRATQRQQGVRLEGILARLFYWGLHKKHQAIVLGYWHVLWQMISNLFSGQRKQPNIKLH